MDARPTHRVGRTDVVVSDISFGGAPIGNFLRPFSDADARRMLDEAWGLGIRYFDTAPLYGHGLSERRVGEALAGRVRSSFTLSTKAGRVLTPADPAGIDSGLWVQPAPYEVEYAYDYDGVMRSVQDSLDRLGVDHLEIVYMHDIDRYTHGDGQAAMFRTALDEGFAALVALREQGVVDAVGFGVNEADVCAEAVRRADADVVLLAGRYTLLEQDPLGDLLPLCESRGIGVVLGGVYNSGILATGAAAGAKFDYALAPPEVVDTVRRLQAVCDAHDVPLPAAALQFAAAPPAVSSICVGSRTPQQQRTSVELFDLPIPRGFWDDLRSEGLIRADAPVPRPEKVAS